MTYDENDVYNGPDTKRRGPFLFMAAMVGVILVAGGVAAASEVHAASDSQTPYTVTVEGVTLPTGTTFPESGHVNWRTDRGSHSVHFDPNNNQPGAVWIGKNTFTFTPALLPGECLVWVQVSLYDEHFGEGGQAPICNNGGTPSTTPVATEPASPSPTPTATTEPTPLPTPTDSPTSTPEPSSANPQTVYPPASTTDSPPTTSDSSPSAPARLADTGRHATIWDLAAVLFAGCVIGLGVFSIARRNA